MEKYKHLSSISRFVSKLDHDFTLSRTHSRCVEWKGSLDTRGYGLFRSDNRLYKAHRFMLEKILNINIPENHVVMHSCDNPKCVNPEHLSIGTQKDNVRDRENKGRSNRRTRSNTHGMTKISEEKLITGFEMFQDGYSRSHISRWWGVSYAHTCRLLKRMQDDI